MYTARLSPTAGFWSVIIIIRLAFELFQNPPELDAPLFSETDAGKGAEVVDPGLDDLQKNVF